MGKEDKTFFDKKIVYLDYLESGEKIKNGGFVKWDVRGEDCRIQIHIRGLYTTDTLQGEIKLISREETYGADRIGLQYGTGEYASHWKNSNLAGTGLSYAECDGILIRLSDTRVLKGQWRERAKEADLLPQDRPEEIQSEEETSETAAAVETKESEAEITVASEAAESIENIEPIENAEPEQLEAEVSEVSDIKETDQPKPKIEEAEEAGEIREAEEAGEVEKAEEAEESKTEMKEDSQPVNTPQPEQVTTGYPLSQDKWEQLERLYPKIHPFGDSREYLSITPRDFIVLARQHQELVQNSFLLHGYYNYGHLILTKIVERDEDRYYLGVPGVYFDRERQAALMFGFEGFEAGTDKMEDGGFGYYMKRVEI